MRIPRVRPETVNPGPMTSRLRPEGDIEHMEILRLLQARLLFGPLRVQVPNNQILTQNLYYNYYYPRPKYLIIGYMDP